MRCCSAGERVLQAARGGPGAGQTVYNDAMYHRSVVRPAVFVAAFALVISALAVVGQDAPQKRGRKYKTPPPTARITVTVLREVNGKPIENAAVIFHEMAGERSEERRVGKECRSEWS